MLIGFLPYREMNMSSKDSMLNSRKRHVSNVSRMCYTQMRHHRADHLCIWKTIYGLKKDYLRLEKTIYGLEKTIYGLRKTIYGFEVISAELWVYFWSHDTLVTNQWSRIYEWRIYIAILYLPLRATYCIYSFEWITAKINSAQNLQ